MMVLRVNDSGWVSPGRQPEGKGCAGKRDVRGRPTLTPHSDLIAAAPELSGALSG
jgi:hypothetical protein